VSGKYIKFIGASPEPCELFKSLTKTLVVKNLRFFTYKSFLALPFFKKVTKKVFTSAA
jgi:hypothetical protein